ncbi:nucleoside phosphorylase [Saccharothrix carnea]|uniref:Nucleoside phosphorylase n=1 Tax=Saccharothrix carnea TaxID=1280637 RepID=A0A2P8I4J5_SACCR|nr:5'-methylthioadenosine/S-adenosylhomocysteine nucleosidase [Saccharothrix carnea]PSL53373.1 nucleoside phosphorylase [Saccharothrix carnea]
MIVILTALPVEYDAVRAHLTDLRTHRHGAGTLFDTGFLASHPTCRIALAATGMGNLSAATLTERAVVEFAPAAMLFVGIAGGLRDRLDIGDVVVGTRVYAYQGGRSDDTGFRARPRAWDVSHRIEQVAGRVSREDRWFRASPDRDGEAVPAVHFGPIAAGEVLLDSRRSDTAKQIDDHYNDAVAVEMESAGFALAGHLNNGIPTATIRAISDHADGHKYEADDAGSQVLAARNAAAFAVAVAGTLDRYDAEQRDSGKPDEHDAPYARLSNQNIARDHAHVDRQVGFDFGAGFPSAFRNGDDR